jgi:4-hydroxy-tetrahydrodipicolinate reductase
MSIRLLIHGASGRMGRALLRLASEEAQLQVVAAVSGQGGHIAEASQIPVLAANAMAQAPEFDVLVDFSLPSGFDAALQLAQQRKAAFVSGVTGLGEMQRAALDAAAEQIPVLWASNFSLGIAVLTDLVQRAAAALPRWQKDIVESHHILKKDAPSGTALTLGAAVKAGAGEEPNYASVRAGDIVGEHMVQLTGLGERLELIHRATSRDVFARGALQCAAWLHGRNAGRYSVSDLLSGEA